MYQNWVLGYRAKRPIFRGGDIMIKFSAPGYIEHDIVIMHFIHTMKEHPEYFIENRILDSAYGMPGYMIWNGGRSKFNLKIEANDIYDLVDEYKKLNFKLCYKKM